MSRIISWELVEIFWFILIGQLGLLEIEFIEVRQWTSAYSQEYCFIIHDLLDIGTESKIMNLHLVKVQITK